jgi:hypothetical protein
MRIKATRGVCVGVEDYLKEGDIRDLDPATADYLKNIGAAVDMPEAEAPPPGPMAEQEAAAAAAAASGTETAPEGGSATPA